VRESAVKTARVLIVDDQAANTRLLEGILKHAGYIQFKSTTDSRQAIPLYAEFMPDLMLLDLHMPLPDGYQVMEQLKGLVPEGTYFPILVLTADITLEAKQRALAAGAKDFVTKPFDPIEVLLRLKNLLETRFLHLALQDHNRLLEEKVRERTADLEQAKIEIIERLAVAIEYRDDVTGKHVQRVGEISGMLARTIGLTEDTVRLIRRAAPLHDVGKIGVPDHILLKPERLTAEESDIMKTHTTIGARILSGSRFPLLQTAEEIALTHHEQWDGGGYPHGLEGTAIPITGRIVAVADAYDTMTNDRPYRKALSPKDAMEILWRGAGSQWDKTVVEAFASSSPGEKGGGDDDPDASRAVRRREVSSHSRR
jgi:putative two-component system response regulator